MNRLSSKTYTRYTLEEKQQIIKWYYGGKTLNEVIKLLASKYKLKNVPVSTIRKILRLFGRNGCVQNCYVCNGKVFRSKSDEREMLEIMVCAAKELELSMRDIAFELDVTKEIVCKILKRYGYCNVDEKEVLSKVIETKWCPEENVQIIKWYCTGKLLSEIVQLFTVNYNPNSRKAQEIVDLIIQHFETSGCARNCKKCQDKANKSLQQMENIIRNERVSSEPEVEMEDNLNNQFPPKSMKILDKKIEKHCNWEEPGHSIEFVSVEPTLNIIVVEEKT